VASDRANSIGADRTNTTRDCLPWGVGGHGSRLRDDGAAGADFLADRGVPEAAGLGDDRDRKYGRGRDESQGEDLELHFVFR